ncbi:hypothetical protein NDU88_007257 [Pleurodeles waltl]|uniref:Uncharacterized protein n=1 Tax=Pleurodeles waltl TaxID=8319 RepID=A0AAV7NT49_PLEWA|nr:hypothetical protein NDU88_007257 [Pleurodeles waltl]
MLLQRRSKKEQGSVRMLSGSPKRQRAPDPGVRRSGCAAGRPLEPGARLGQILLPGACQATNPGVGGAAVRQAGGWIMGRGWGKSCCLKPAGNAAGSSSGSRRCGCVAGRRLEPGTRLGQILLPGACRKCVGLQFRESEVWLCSRQAAGVWGEARANPVAWSLPGSRYGSRRCSFAAGSWLEPEARLGQMLPGACCRSVQVRSASCQRAKQEWLIPNGLLIADCVGALTAGGGRGKRRNFHKL